MHPVKTYARHWQALLLSVFLMASGQSYAAQSITFYHNDILGSPVATTDENGNICWREDYQPYGEKLKNDDGYEPSTAGCGLDDNQRGYTGHVHDKDIGLTYMQARYYDPIVGRFMGIDPVGVRLDNQVSFNRYAYGNNNPYKFVDPDGMEADDGLGEDFGDPIGSLGNYADAQSMHGFESRNDEGLQDIFAELFGYNDLVEARNNALDGDITGVFTSLALIACKPCKATKSGTTVIGRVKDLQNFKKGEQSLLNRLPDRGSAKANWKQNSGVLRQEMSKGKPIRDASPSDNSGQFLNSERNLLRDRGWNFDSQTNNWTPPN